jgi:hypothetical protein
MSRINGGELMRLLLSLLGALGVLAGCTILPSGPGAIVGDLMVTLSVNGAAESARASQGNPVHLRLYLINRGRPRTLILSQRPAYDFVVTTSKGMEIWRWSYNKTIEDLPKEIWAGSLGIAFEANVEWDQRDLDGNPVPVGTYWVQGMLYTQSGIFKSQKVELRIRRATPLRVELEIPSQVPVYGRWRDYYYWKLGQPLPLTLKLRNVTDKPVELTLLKRPAYDFVVTTDYGRKEVWRFSADQAVFETSEEHLLAPLEELQFMAEWDQRDSEGQLILPGYYCIEAFVNAIPEVENSARRCLSIGRGLPLRISLEVPSSVQAGESLPLIIKVENPFTCPVTLVNVSTDFTVETSTGELVWRESEARRFVIPIKPPAWPYALTLEPGDSHSFETTWDQLDLEGYTVKPGVYWVRGFVLSSQGIDAYEILQSDAKPLTIKP